MSPYRAVRRLEKSCILQERFLRNRLSADLNLCNAKASRGIELLRLHLRSRTQTLLLLTFTAVQFTGINSTRLPVGKVGSCHKIAVIGVHTTGLHPEVRLLLLTASSRASICLLRSINNPFNTVTTFIGSRKCSSTQ